MLSVLKQSTRSGLHEAAELCIATSYFSDSDWKDNALHTADLLIQDHNRAYPHSQADVVFRARLVLRKASYCMSQSAAVLGISENDQQLMFLRDTAWANAFAADVALIKARWHVQHGDHSSAHSELSSFKPLFSSAFEQAQQQKIEAMRGAVYRFEGRFREAHEVLSAIYHPSNSSGTLTHLSAVLCELGQQDTAKAKVHEWLQLCTSITSGAAVRARLSLADAYLMSGLRQLLSGQPGSHSSCREAQSMYRDLRTTNRLAWFEHVAILIGIAITEHVVGKPDDAIHAWQAVWSFCDEVQLAPGYTHLIVRLSLAELELRKGGEARTIMAQARHAFARAGQEYYFTGLGTTWPEVLNSWSTGG